MRWRATDEMEKERRNERASWQWRLSESQRQLEKAQLEIAQLQTAQLRCLKMHETYDEKQCGGIERGENEKDGENKSGGGDGSVRERKHRHGNSRHGKSSRSKHKHGETKQSGTERHTREGKHRHGQGGSVNDRFEQAWEQYQKSPGYKQHQESNQKSGCHSVFHSCNSWGWPF